MPRIGNERDIACDARAARLDEAKLAKDGDAARHARLVELDAPVELHGTLGELVVGTGEAGLPPFGRFLGKLAQDAVENDEGLA